MIRVAKRKVLIRAAFVDIQGSISMHPVASSPSVQFESIIEQSCCSDVGTCPRTLDNQRLRFVSIGPDGHTIVCAASACKRIFGSKDFEADPRTTALKPGDKAKAAPLCACPVERRLKWTIEKFEALHRLRNRKPAELLGNQRADFDTTAFKRKTGGPCEDQDLPADVFTRQIVPWIGLGIALRMSLMDERRKRPAAVETVEQPGQ